MAQFKLRSSHPRGIKTSFCFVFLPFENGTLFPHVPTLSKRLAPSQCTKKYLITRLLSVLTGLNLSCRRTAWRKMDFPAFASIGVAYRTGIYSELEKVHRPCLVHSIHHVLCSFSVYTNEREPLRVVFAIVNWLLRKSLDPGRHLVQPTVQLLSWNNTYGRRRYIYVPLVHIGAVAQYAVCVCGGRDRNNTIWTRSRYLFRYYLLYWYKEALNFSFFIFYPSFFFPSSCS